MAGPELIAHRGWARRFPENTLAAVRGALEAGARFVEVDVQLSADRVPFLLHDRTLERMCGAPGALHERASSELAVLPASERGRFGERFADERLATLASFAELLGERRGVQTFVEIKRAAVEAFGAEAVAEAVVAALEPLESRCTLISFDLTVLEAARRRSRVPVGPVLIAWEHRTLPAILALEPAVVFCDVEKLPPEGEIRPPRGRLAVYEVDDPDQARALHARGAELIETFAIGEMLAALGANA